MSSKEMSDTRPAVDHEVFLQLQDLQVPGEPDVRLLLTGAFVKTSDEFLQTLKEKTDTATARQIGHSWKSSARALGAMQLAELCARLESEAALLSDQRRMELTGAIAGEYARVLSEIEALMRGIKPI